MVYSDMNTAFSRNLEIQKGTCPSGQVPFIIVRVMITPLRLPARRLTEADYQHITEIWETSGKHYEHELHILHPISTKYLRVSLMNLE